MTTAQSMSYILYKNCRIANLKDVYAICKDGKLVTTAPTLNQALSIVDKLERG